MAYRYIPRKKRKNNLLQIFAMSAPPSYSGAAGSGGAGEITSPETIFRGAEGFGVLSPGGRGGATLRVTTLADSGSGSLRDALTTPGAREIVFDVAGIIQLETFLRITDPFVSVLGGTAPSPGITIRDNFLWIDTHDMLLQHIRIRVGDLGTYPDPESIDGILVGSLGTIPAYNIVVDHCSVYWSIDEIIATGHDDTHDVTFSNCIFAEALNDSLHPSGPHSAGPLISDSGSTAKRIALLNNLIAHCAFRTPDCAGGTHTLIVNNVVYDSQDIFMAVQNVLGSTNQTKSTVVGNVTIKGPSGVGALTKALFLYELPPDTEIFADDNLCTDFVEGDPLSSIEFTVPPYDELSLDLVSHPPVMVEPLTIRSSFDTEAYVLANAGARPWDRDFHDRRVVDQVTNLTGGFIDSQSEVGGWAPEP